LRQINLDADKVEITGLDLPIVARFTLCFICKSRQPSYQGPAMNQTFDVKGMTCGHCEKAVTRAIKQLDPQAEVKIDRNLNQVEVQSQQPREALAKAIAEEGYAVTA
jgi:copper chaperone